MTSWTKEQLKSIETEGTNIIISAGAGSGKTAVLTERVINKLKNNTHINELLILTFTNNAAAEMKDRIKRKIKENPILKDELKLIESANIMTFDAFTLSLVKKYHYYLDLENNINIIDSSIIKEKKKKIIDQLFNKYYENNNEDFINFVKKYGVKNDKSIRNKLIELDYQLDLLTNKESYLLNYINNYYSDNNINKLFKEYEELILKRIESIKNALLNLSYYIDNDFYLKISNAIKSLINSKTYEEIKNNLDIPTIRMPNGSDELAKYYKAQIFELIKSLKDLCIDSKQTLINDLKSTKNDATIIINILIELNNEINNYKIKHNMFEFNDISKFAIKLLENNENVRTTLKNSFKEIMVDEYQDTSDIQEKFISLIENNNVYMVGDVKQSIYRFRNANPDIFKIKYDKYKNNDGGIKIDLNKNFRSRPEVLDSINQIFNHIMDNEIGNAKYKEEHQLQFGNESYKIEGNNNYNNNLEIYNYIKDDSHTKEEIEAFIIGNDIINKIKNKYKVLDDKNQRDITYKDFCILMDRTTSFNIYKKVFNYLKIPLNIYKDNDILLSDETYIIYNIISLIIDIKNNVFNELDKFYYTSISRSYLYQIDDNTIYKIIKNNKIKETEIYLKCLEISKNIDSLSNEQIIYEIINKFNIYEKMITIGDIKERTIIIDNIINKSIELNEIGNNIYDMKEYFQSLIDSKESIRVPAIITETDSVTITNIHKSKGLEYKICYYSGLHKEFNIMELKSKIIYNNKYGLILPTYDEGFKNTFINFLNKEKYIKEEISEKIRLFYVALTRSKEKMIMVTELNDNEISITDNNEIIDYLKRNSYKSFKDILNSIYNYIEHYITKIEIPEIDNDYQYEKEFNINKFNINLEPLEINEIKYEANIINEEHYSKETNKLLTETEKENMEFGIKMHYLLENINLINPDYSVLNEFEIDTIKSLLNNKIFNNIREAKIYKEYEFIDESDSIEKAGIIDLMLEYNNYIDIIDYKLKNTDDIAYKKQLNGYKTFIQNKTNKKVNIYLYSLIDKKLITID